MKNHTKDQKYNRAKEKETERNFKKQKEREAKLSNKLPRKVLSVSIKQEAFEKLELAAKKAKLPIWKMLSHILFKIYELKPSIKISGIKTKRYKASTGNKQLNYKISERAWNNLDILSKAEGKSKARLVQELIMAYEIPSDESLEKKKREKTEKEKQIYYQSMSHTKNLVIDNENNIVHKEGTPISKWSDNEYSQLMYLTKIQIGIFKEIQRKEIQRKEAEEELSSRMLSEEEIAKFLESAKHAQQDISEPPDWVLEQLEWEKLRSD